MKSNGEEKLFAPPFPEEGEEIDANSPMFKVMLFCWASAEEQEHVRDEFIEFLEKMEEDES
jgi:hypothetical protein